MCDGDGQIFPVYVLQYEFRFRECSAAQVEALVGGCCLPGCPPEVIQASPGHCSTPTPSWGSAPGDPRFTVWRSKLGLSSWNPAPCAGDGASGTARAGAIAKGGNRGFGHGDFETAQVPRSPACLFAPSSKAERARNRRVPNHDGVLVG